MKLTLVDWSIIAAYFLFNLLIGFYYKKQSRARTSEILPLRPQRAVVAGRHVDGGDDFRRRHAAGGHRPGGAQRHRRQLAVVEHGRERHADRLSLFAAVAALRR